MKKLATGLVGLATLLLILSGCTKKPEPSKTTSSKEKVKTSQSSTKEKKVDKTTPTSTEETKVTFTNDEIVAIAYIENYMGHNPNDDINMAINDILNQPQFMISEASGTYTANEEINLEGNDTNSKVTISGSNVHAKNFIGTQLSNEKDYLITQLTTKYSPYIDSIKKIVQLSQKNAKSINWSNNEQDKQVINTFCELLGSRFVSTTPNDYTASYLIGNPYYEWRYEDSTTVLIDAKIIGRMSDSTADDTKFRMKDEETGKEFTLTFSRNVEWDMYRLRGDTPIGAIDKEYVDVNSSKNTKADSSTPNESSEPQKDTSLNGDDSLQGDTGEDASNPFD